MLNLMQMHHHEHVESLSHHDEVSKKKREIKENIFYKYILFEPYFYNEVFVIHHALVFDFQSLV
jgi:hypothetical protein